MGRVRPGLHAGWRARQLDLRLLDRIARGGLVEVFEMFLPAGTEHLGGPHGSGVVERVFVYAGTITVGPASDPLTLGPGYGAPRVYLLGRELVTIGDGMGTESISSTFR